jgi:hypothetical protein
VRLDATDVVPSEQALDRVGMRQRTARAGDAPRRGVLDGAGFRVGGDRRRTSGALNLNLLDERPLAEAQARRDRAAETALRAGALSLIESTAHGQLLQVLR